MRVYPAVLVWGIVVLLGAVRASFAAGPVLTVERPELLEALEERGFGFGALFGQSEAANLEVLAGKSAAYGALLDLIAADVGHLRQEMAAGGRPLQEVTDQNAGR